MDTRDLGGSPFVPCTFAGHEKRPFAGRPLDNMAEEEGFEPS